MAIREAVTVIRGMFRGETVKFDGKIFKVRGANLDFKARDNLPIYIAGRGPEILKLAGEVADGVMIGGFADRPSVNYAFEQIKKGAKKAGRSLNDIDTVSWVYCCISKDGDAAKRMVKPIIMGMIRSSKSTLGKLGVEQNLLDHIVNTEDELKRRGKLYSSSEFIEAASRIVPDEYTKRYSIAGTPEECLQKVKELVSLGMKQVAILPFPLPGHGKDDVIRNFAREVISKM